MQIIETIAGKLGVKNWQVEAAVKLIDEGNTIPFIARYRKEATGTLTDEQLRELGESLAYLRSLEERKSKVMESIEAQGKLTKELKSSIEAAQTLVEVEDLYLPYRPKRRTRAGIAKEKGLQGLADYILALKPGSDVRGEAARYVNEEKEVKDADEAIAGAMDIIAEQISDEARFRAWIREKTQARGTVVTAEKVRKKTKDDAETDEKTPAKLKERRGVYEMYFEYEEAVRRIPGHRVLAINRGEKEGFLSVKIAAPEDDILFYLERQVTRGAKNPDPDAFSYIKAAVKDSYDRLIAPAIEREIRNQLTEDAEDGAIRVFASNLEQLLMQQPIAGKVVLGWDPAFRTGCKLAVADPTGRILDTKVIYPTAPQNKVREAEQLEAGIAPVVPEKEFGFVAVAAGHGIETLFTDLGVDFVVRGGQTMNPSTDDILRAILATPAKTVFVLPNNKNIIMAAEQAVKLTDKSVCVLQTRTVPQGISAMMAFDDTLGLAENRINMTKAFEKVSTGLITFAARDSEFEGHTIKEGEILALDNGKLSFTEKDISKATLKLTKKLAKNGASYVTVIYGSDVTEENAEQMQQLLQSKLSDKIEVMLVNGGQPVYYYIISVE